jgi:hypothetical protein
VAAAAFRALQGSRGSRCTPARPSSPDGLVTPGPPPPAGVAPMVRSGLPSGRPSALRVGWARWARGLAYPPPRPQRWAPPESRAALSLEGSGCAAAQAPPSVASAPPLWAVLPPRAGGAGTPRGWASRVGGGPKVGVCGHLGSLEYRSHEEILFKTTKSEGLTSSETD